MASIERGRILGSSIVFAGPLGIPDGTEVLVRIEPVSHQDAMHSKQSAESFVSLPFFGMWKDRTDIGDSADWVRQERQKWHQRAAHRD